MPRAIKDRRVWVPIAVVAAAALVVGLVAGVLVGGRTDLVRSGSPNAAVGADSVSVGAIEQYRLHASTGWDFQLPVYNPTDRSIGAELVSLEGLVSPFTSDKAEQIVPRSWGVIRFSAAPNCESPPPTSVSSVGLRIAAAGADIGSGSEVTRPLPGGGNVLVEHDQAVCGVGRAVTPDELAGVWIVERAYGPDMYLAGTYLMRFTRSGSFAADPDGRLFSSRPAVQGTYRIRRGLLEITTRNSSGCGAGTRATWRAAFDARARLTMVYVKGDCPEGDQGDVWVARRALHDDGLPGD